MTLSLTDMSRWTCWRLQDAWIEVFKLSCSTSYTQGCQKQPDPPLISQTHPQRCFRLPGPATIHGGESRWYHIESSFSPCYWETEKAGTELIWVLYRKNDFQKNVFFWCGRKISLIPNALSSQQLHNLTSTFPEPNPASVLHEYPSYT